MSTPSKKIAKSEINRLVADAAADPDIAKLTLMMIVGHQIYTLAVTKLKSDRRYSKQTIDGIINLSNGVTQSGTFTAGAAYADLCSLMPFIKRITGGSNEYIDSSPCKRQGQDKLAEHNATDKEAQQLEAGDIRGQASGAHS